MAKLKRTRNGRKRRINTVLLMLLIKKMTQKKNPKAKNIRRNKMMIVKK